MLGLDSTRGYIKVDSPPAVSFWNGTNVLPYKIHGRAHHTICMGEAESPPDLPYKIHGDHPRGRREEGGPVGHLRRHGFPREVSEGACRVGWPVVAVQVGNSHVYLSPAAPPCIQYERGGNTH